MAYPNQWRVDHITKLMATERASNGNRNWVPARPIGLPSVWRRFKLGWMVFTGKADALVWEEQ